MIDAAALTGHWRRDWLRTPERVDETTRVHWMQAQAGYADLRVPVDQPKVAADVALASLDDWTLLALLRGEGFAGTITVADDVCTWERAINWHGQPEGVDAGAMDWDENGALIETGTGYSERWLREDDVPNAAWVFRAEDLTMHLVWSETTFLMGIGKPDAPSSAPLRTALAKGKRPPALAEHFRGLFALGEWRDGWGVVRLSLHPGLVGSPLIDRTAMELGRFTLQRPDFNGGPLIEEWLA